MMKKLLLLFLPLSLLVACGESTGPDASELAAQSAKVYYEQLLKGDYASFVDGTYRADSIPKSYREQLIANAKMFVGQQNDEHHGIKEVRVIRATADTARHAATVFLGFVYGDSLNEQVVVPMVERGGVWYMR